MALSTDVEEELSCPVCCEHFIDQHIPKLLDCRHDVCQPCLQKVATDGSIKCPQCRETTIVKSGVVTSLKPNFRVRNLAEIYFRTNKKELLCNLHKDQKLLCVCVSCNVPVCQFCIVEDHQEPPGIHLYKKRKDVLKERKAEAKNILAEALTKIEQCKKRLKELKERSALLVKEELNVLTHVNELVDDVQQKRTEIVCELQHKENERLRNIERKLSLCHGQAERLDYASGTTREMNDTEFEYWFQMTTCSLEEVFSNVNHYPDVTKPFAVSKVELGIHPGSLNIKHLVKSSKPNRPTRIDPENPPHVAESGEFGLFDDYSPCKKRKIATSEDCEKMKHTLADINEEATRCKRALAVWKEIHEKVSVSLDEEMQKISTRVQKILDEIIGQGNAITHQLHEDTCLKDIDAESERYHQHVEKLQDTYNTLDKLNDDGYVTQYDSVANKLKEMLREVSEMFTGSSNDVPKFESILGTSTQKQTLYVGQVKDNSKLIYVRKQLITQFNCGSPLRSIDATSEGYLVLVSDDSFGVTIPGSSFTIGNHLHLWTDISGEYKQILCMNRADNNNPYIPTDVAVDSISKRYLVARTTELESYSELGVYDSTLLSSPGIDEQTAWEIRSIATNGKGHIVAGNVVDSSLFILPPDGLVKFIKVPFRPCKIAAYDTLVAYTDMEANRVHCFNFQTSSEELSEVFNIYVPSPTGVCFDNTGSHLYICKRDFDSGCGSVDLYCSVTGDMKENVVSSLESPQDIALLPEGKLAVADGEWIKIYGVQ